MTVASNQILGRDKELAIIRDFITNFSKQKKKALFLYGPCGSGKTSAVVSIVNELEYELLEINSSDSRNKDHILSIVGPAIKQKSFFHKGKVILLDEIDGISGNADRGGVSELSKIIEESIVPLIFTANDMSLDNLKPIVKQSQMLCMDRLSEETIVDIIKLHAADRKIKIQADAAEALARFCDGDARAALNDLLVLSATQPVKKDAVLLLSQRRRTQTMETALTTLFKTTDALTARNAFELVDEDVDEQFLWLDYNIPFEYTEPEDLARAYAALAKADVFRKRIKRNQEWTLLPYVIALMTAGVSTAKEKPYAKKTEYKRTMRLLKIWQVNMSNAKRKIIAEKLGEHIHCSTKKAFAQMDEIRALAQRDSAFLEQFANQLALDDEQKEWLAAK